MQFFQFATVNSIVEDAAIHKPRISAMPVQANHQSRVKPL
jgi:hypothetical protein